jgi:hypothetical protein
MYMMHACCRFVHRYVPHVRCVLQPNLVTACNICYCAILLLCYVHTNRAVEAGPVEDTVASLARDAAALIKQEYTAALKVSCKLMLLAQ